MELRILGYNSPYPPPGGAGPGYLITAGGQKVLLECGSGVVSRLKPYCDFRRDELRAVVLSHLHPDHFSDLLVLRYAHLRNMLEREVGPLPVYLPDTPLPEREVIAYRSLNLISIAPESVCSIGPLTLRFFATDHPVTCCAMRVDDGSSTFFYTADTAWHDELPRQAAGVDLLMAEASFLERDKGDNVPKHLTAAECGRLARQAGVGRLLLTHFWPEYDPRDLLSEAAEEYSGEIILASEAGPIIV